MCKQFFLKKQRVVRLHFFYVSTDVKWKTCSPSYFSLLAAFVHSPSVCSYGTNSPYEGGHSIAHSISVIKNWRKDHFGLFLDTSNEAKKFIKLIVVDSNHFIRYSCKAALAGFVLAT